MRARRIALSTLVVSSLLSTFLLPIPGAQALLLEKVSAPWVNFYASASTERSPHVVGINPSGQHVGTLSSIKVTYKDVPTLEQAAVQAAVDIWSDNWISTVPVNVVTNYVNEGTGGILASATPVSFFHNFSGAPDSTLWYASALANALAGKDLDPANPEITININSTMASSYYLGTDGNCPKNQYDLESIILHELAHGLGFLSNNTYDITLGYGTIDQPTPFDAYSQTPDGGRLMDLPSPSIQLGLALQNKLVWSGKNGIIANNGEKPLLYTPTPYQSGSSVSHLDQNTFTNSGANALMTPSWPTGAVYHQPGPLVIAMMKDMRIKPPAGIPAGIPDPPRNVYAIVGDKTAIVSFDPPDNARTSQVASYEIKVNETGAIVQAMNSPVTISGLQNGSHYSFTVTATNAMGTSMGASSNAIFPQAQWKSTVLDSSADAKYLVSTTFRNNPIVVYSDTKKGDLKIAMWNGKGWVKSTIDGNSTLAGRTLNDVSGNISVCTSAAGPKQRLNIFYADLSNKWLRYAGYDGKSWTFSIVDGNGPEINKYTDPNRVRTSSDVSGPSACVDTKDGLQVFYRDQGQGILLGAVKNGKNWQYELVDGDRATNGRTTGDVGFHIEATNLGPTVYLVYDSILQVNQQKQAIQGEVRLAVRSSAYPEDWKYNVLDSASADTAVAGYDVALSSARSTIVATWMVAEALTIPHPDQLRWVDFTHSGSVNSSSTDIYGTPSAPLASDGEKFLFNCQSRLCAFNTSDETVSLVTTRDISSSLGASWVVVNKVRYALVGVDGKLVLLKAL